jgi:hypothetical protein
MEARVTLARREEGCGEEVNALLGSQAARVEDVEVSRKQPVDPLRR